VTDILTTIDDTLTYHSAALGEDLTVPVEREDDDEMLIPVAANTTYEFAWALDLARISLGMSRLLEPIVAVVKSFDEIVPALLAADAARRARLRRMRHLYRMRRR
jgi:hypothetical protein